MNQRGLLSGSPNTHQSSCVSRLDRPRDQAAWSPTSSGSGGLCHSTNTACTRCRLTRLGAFPQKVPVVKTRPLPVPLRWCMLSDQHVFAFSGAEEGWQGTGSSLVLVAEHPQGNPKIHPPNPKQVPKSTVQPGANRRHSSLKHRPDPAWLMPRRSLVTALRFGI